MGGGWANAGMVKLHSLCFLAKVAWVCCFCVRADFGPRQLSFLREPTKFWSREHCFLQQGTPGRAALRCECCSFALLRGGGGRENRFPAGKKTAFCAFPSASGNGAPPKYAGLLQTAGPCTALCSLCVFLSYISIIIIYSIIYGAV